MVTKTLTGNTILEVETTGQHGRNAALQALPRWLHVRYELPSAGHITVSPCDTLLPAPAVADDG